MKLKLIDGKIVEGTVHEIFTFLNTNRNDSRVAMGEYGNKVFYKSESKVFLPIASMDIYHVKKAVCRIYREWVSQLHTLEPKDCLRRLERGLTDETFLALVDALGRGVDEL